MVDFGALDFSNQLSLGIFIKSMIEESLEKQTQLRQLLTSASEKRNLSQQFLAYQQITASLTSKINRKQISTIIHQLFRNLKGGKLFLSLFGHLSKRVTEHHDSQLQTSFVKTIMECFQMEHQNNQEIFCKKKILAEVVMESKTNLLQDVLELCRQSQLGSLNVIISLNEMLIQKIKGKSAIDLFLTHSTVYSIKIVQFWQHYSSVLIQEAIRHLLIIDYIQEGEVLEMIRTNDLFLTKLTEMLQKSQGLSGYWFYLASKLTTSKPNIKALQLQEQTMNKIFQTVKTDSNLSEEIVNIQSSQLTDHDKKRNIQLIRSYCIFTGVFVKKQIKSGNLEEKIIGIIEQLMGIRDFLSFQHLVTQYAEIIKVQPQKIGKVSPQLIQKIQRNCLPRYVKSNVRLQQQSSPELSFLSGKFESLYDYQSYHSPSEAMKYLLDLILQQRGCKDKPKVCPCFDSYIHDTIQHQYDQMFNEHDFMSATNLICRESGRVLEMKPSFSELQDLKNYLFNYLKWLLNLNESCMPQYRRCINFKIFDIIFAFPYILQNNDFLQQVTEDLLVDRIPDTFFHLGQLVKFMMTDGMSQGNEVKLERIVEKVLKKCNMQGLTFMDKINVWSLVFGIISKKEEKLKEVLEMYSLHEDQWMAKKQAAKMNKITLPQAFSIKVQELQQKWASNSEFYSLQLTIIRQNSQQK